VQQVAKQMQELLKSKSAAHLFYTYSASVKNDTGVDYCAQLQDAIGQDQNKHLVQQQEYQLA
jgi:HPt (histidine-containing phosphotransfer) domain-containing protein